MLILGLQLTQNWSNWTVVCEMTEIPLRVSVVYVVLMCNCDIAVGTVLGSYKCVEGRQRRPREVGSRNGYLDGIM